MIQIDMDEKQEKEIYFAIKKLGIQKTKELLKKFLDDDNFEFYFEDEESIIILAFGNFYNFTEFSCDDAAISGFIQMNLQIGKKWDEEKVIDWKDIEQKFYEKFGITPEKKEEKVFTEEELLEIEKKIFGENKKKKK